MHSHNHTTNSPPDLLGVADLATELGVSQHIVRGLVKKGLIRRLPGLYKITVTRAALDEYLNSSAPLDGAA